MGKTAGPLPPLRKPRNHAPGQDALVSDRPRRLPEATAALLLQELRQHLYLGA
jgi:hypothetical protein